MCHGIGMNINIAWETTIDDIELVLQDLSEDIALAPELYRKLDLNAVEKAALDSGIEMELQTVGAYDEIKRQIKSLIVEGKI